MSRHRLQPAQMPGSLSFVTLAPPGWHWTKRIAPAVISMNAPRIMAVVMKTPFVKMPRSRAMRLHAPATMTLLAMA